MPQKPIKAPSTTAENPAIWCRCDRRENIAAMANAIKPPCKSDGCKMYCTFAFETGLMCSGFCRPLIFNRLKNKVRPEINSLKWLSGACSDGERSLLLRKEWGNAGKMRLLRKEWGNAGKMRLLRKEWGNDGKMRLLLKECRVDFRLKWVKVG